MRSSGKTFVQVDLLASTTISTSTGLCSLYTDAVKYLTSQVFFIHSFHTAFGQFNKRCKQAFWGKYNLLLSYLYTLSTPPTITTNLYKGITI